MLGEPLDSWPRPSTQRRWRKAASAPRRVASRPRGDESSLTRLRQVDVDDDGVAADALYSYLKASGISIPWQVALSRRGQELRGVPAPRHTPIEFERASEIELAALRRMQGLGPESAFTAEHVGP